tara:strand:- start:20 stop:457 length:438 start_codon:yes stop_codon:yes gene_type:complete
MFKVRKNILNTKEKNKLLKFVKTKVKSIYGCPGLQTDSNLHTYREMDYFLDKIKNEVKNYRIVKCWGNYTDGSYSAWHDHPSKYALVYYLYSPENLGVMFRKENDTIEYTKGLENSIAMFNSNKIHSVPNSPKKINRYSIAVDLQ